MTCHDTCISSLAAPSRFALGNPQPVRIQRSYTVTSPISSPTTASGSSLLPSCSLHASISTSSAPTSVPGSPKLPGSPRWTGGVAKVVLLISPSQSSSSPSMSLANNILVDTSSLAPSSSTDGDRTSPTSTSPGLTLPTPISISTDNTSTSSASTTTAIIPPTSTSDATSVSPYISSTSQSPSLASTVFVTTSVITHFRTTHTPYASIVYITSVETVMPSTTIVTAVISSGVLSTSPPGNKMDTAIRPGVIVGIVLGVLGAFVILALWAFCTRRRLRKLRNSTTGLDWDPSRINWTPDTPRRHMRGVLDGEDDSELGGSTSRVMEERFAGILAAMRADADEVLSDDGHGMRSVSPTGIPLPASPILASSSSVVGHAPTAGFSQTFASLAPPLEGPLQVTKPPHAYTVEGAPYAYTTDQPQHIYGEPSYHGHQSLISSSDAMLARDYSFSGHRTSPGPDAGAWLGGREYSEFGVGQQGRNGLLFRQLSDPQSLAHSLPYSQSQSTGAPTHSGSEEPLLARSNTLGNISMNGSMGMNPQVRARVGSSSSSASHGHVLVTSKDKRTTRSAVPPTSYTFSQKKSQSSTNPPHTGRQGGMRAFLGRLRGGRGTSRGDASLTTTTDTESGGNVKRGSISSLQTSSHALSPPSRTTPPVFSFVLSNPDPHPGSPDMHGADPSERRNVYGEDGRHSISEADAALAPPTEPTHPWIPSNASLPSPTPTEDSVRFKGILDPKLPERRQTVIGGVDAGRSVTSLRDFEDYSRPIGGVVNNRMYSTTTFDTQDNVDSRTEMLNE